MHDLVHDLAILVAKPECNMLNFDSENISIKVWHVSILETDGPKEGDNFKISWEVEQCKNHFIPKLWCWVKKLYICHYLSLEI